MPRGKAVTPIHPLAMADAITNINERAGLLLAVIHTVNDLAAGMTAEQLRENVGRIADAAGELRAAMWPGDEQ